MTADDWKDAAALLGTPVEVLDVLRGEGRNRVARLRVSGTTVIAKRSEGWDDKPFAYRDDADEAPFRRFCNEVAGCEVLGRLGFGPRLMANAPERGIFVMEDLGAGISLADRLLGDDASAAVSALEAYVRTLGRMHRETRGQLSAWDAARRMLGGLGALPVGATDSGMVEAFGMLCARRDVPLAVGIDADFAVVNAAITAPGDWLAFTPSDCCPDNHFVRGDTVVFFDCEFATFRHALLDLAYVVAPFPTCWCCNRLPDGLPQRLVELYRGELDGSDFARELTCCTAFWTVATLCQWWRGDLNDEDRTWGIATFRQRNRLRIDNFLALAATELLPALTETLGRLRDRLPAAEPMSLYPALRG